FMWNSTLIPAHSKGVDDFSVGTDGSGKHPFSTSSDSLTDAWAPTVHKLYHNQTFCGLCDALIDGSTTISRVVIRRFCRMNSSTAEIVALLVTTCACPGSGKSLMFTRPAS
ncbi:hypothetical protein AVEN_13660-1, partial [Araneus ventricosus]